MAFQANMYCRLWIVGFLGITFLAGCGGVDLASEFRDANKSHAAKIRGFYLVFKDKNGMKGPKNKEELLEFMRENPKAYEKNFELQGITMDDVEGFFVSENDGQELRIKWGNNGIVTPPIIFEVEGKDGKVLVVGETVRSLSKEEADKLWNEKKKKSGNKVPGTNEEI